MRQWDVHLRFGPMSMIYLSLIYSLPLYIHPLKELKCSLLVVVVDPFVRYLNKYRYVCFIYVSVSDVYCLK